jgi:signal transduction histidine kinase
LLNLLTFARSAQATVRAKTAATPSVLIGRAFTALLIAPWFFALLLALLHVHPAGRFWTIQAAVWTTLVAFTGVGAVIANGLIKRARGYEVTREGERLLFSNARDAMLVVRVEGAPQGDTESNSYFIVSENPAAAARLGAFARQKTHIGRRLSEVYPEWLRIQIEPEYAACVSFGETRRYEVSHPDGELAHESIAAPVVDATGAVTHIIVIMRDVAERKRHERELGDALRRAEQASVSKSKFLASMSHELRTPLNAILGYSEMLELGIGGSLSVRHREYAQYIHKSGRHLLKIIGDILDLSKIEAGQFKLQFEETAIEPLIDGCILMVRELAMDKGLDLRTVVPPHIPTLSVDSLRVTQVLLNLLSNAIKFTDIGGVTLTASFEESKGLVLAVTDTGKGMSAEEMVVALEPFGQVESAMSRNHDGTGLGLPIARHLVELHGGGLSIASRSGEGTTVTVAIPYRRAAGVIPPVSSVGTTIGRLRSVASSSG